MMPRGFFVLRKEVSMGCTLSVKNMQKIIEELYKKGYAVENARTKALNAGANIILDEMKSTAPKKTGKLVSTLKKGNISKGGIGVGSYDYPIAWYVEYGHGGPHPADPHPYIEPAFESKKGEANYAIAETVKKEMGV